MLNSKIEEQDLDTLFRTSYSRSEAIKLAPIWPEDVHYVSPYRVRLPKFKLVANSFHVKLQFSALKNQNI